MRNSIKMTRQGELFTLATDSPLGKSRPVIATRGNVSTFSSKSRKRALDYTARLQPTAKRRAIFITLTYGQQFPDALESKIHLNTFLQHIRRNFPRAAGMWRFERQERGAPHYHFLFFGMPWWDKEDVAATWLRIVGAQYANWYAGFEQAPFTRIEKIRSVKKCYSYVFKYIAKVKSLGDEGASGFNNIPYPNVWTGRHWGIHNRKRLPLAQKIVFKAVIRDGNTLLAIKMLAAQEWAGIQLYDGRGFTLYLDDIESFWDTCLEILD